MNSLEKWKRSVVHIQCPISSQSPDQIVELSAGLQERFAKGKITPEELREGLKEIGFHDRRVSGTAIFLQHEAHRYLLTARHVVYDENAAEWMLKTEEERLSKMPLQDAKAALSRKLAKENADNCIHRVIFRIPSLDEMQSWDSTKPPPTPLLTTNPQSYTFSDEERDLAVISLDQSNPGFADELVALGYVPVSSNDVADEPSAEGAEVFTVGYLDETSVVGSLDWPTAISYWSSNVMSVPTFSFGRVSMQHHRLSFFWCDMSVYPGNSGGPVVENDKLVGVVNAQPGIRCETLDKNGKELPLVTITRIPFGKMVKGKYVRDLLGIQIQKDIAKSV